MVKKLRSVVSINIKDVDKDAYRKLEAEAIRHNMSIGDAATEAFRLWVTSKRQEHQRDKERIQRAAEVMDKLREQAKDSWSGSKEIRRWRDHTKPQ